MLGCIAMSSPLRGDGVGHRIGHRLCSGSGPARPLNCTQASMTFAYNMKMNCRPLSAQGFGDLIFQFFFILHFGPENVLFFLFLFLLLVLYLCSFLLIVAGKHDDLESLILTIV